MDFIAQLWLPIVLSAAAVWFWAFLSHALLRLHDKDRVKLANEQQFCDSIVQQNIAPGFYIFPFMSHEDCKNPAMKEKWMKGPLGVFHLWDPKAISMPRNMILTYLVYLVASLFMAYIGNLALQPGRDFAHIFQVMGAMGVLAYSFAFLPGMIWFMSPGRAVVMHIVDGVIQGIATGLIFAAMWPSPTAGVLGG